MVDLQTVCCMCGDMGFRDKLFSCIKCRHRFQHSYCSNYYSEYVEPIEVCDWCLSEERNTCRQGSSSKKSSVIVQPSSGDHKIKQPERDENTTTPSEKRNNSKNPSGIPSPRTGTRRFKLLKDIKC